MNNERYKVKTENGFRNTMICVACGAEANRDTAKFCLICGKFLKEDYQPLDRIRSSYNLQGKSFGFLSRKKEHTDDLFEINRNPVAETAWACCVYSFVPYLGILFVPFTFLIGSLGFLTALRNPEFGGRKMSLASIAVSFGVLAVQIFLWWLLYIIPEIGI
ncbi:MAG: hypothetical protein ABIP06_09375 [Pyrinomonadaceae bacterium]